MMAELSYRGLDNLQLDLKTITSLPVEVQDQMLVSAATQTAEGQRRKAIAYRVKDTGRTIKNIKVGKVKTGKHGQRIVYVTVAGTRKRGKTIRKTRNAEIAFINEYGKKGQKARSFVRDGNAASAKSSTEAALEVYDRFLTSNNL